MSTKMNRRDFLRLVGASTGGLILAVYLDGCAPKEQPTATLAAPALTPAPTPPPASWAPDIYLDLAASGILTITAFRSEMGQGIRTALAMPAAEELDVDWADVRIEQADADPRYGDQQTGGSVSVANYYSAMRSAGAAARQMLVTAAAQAWDVDPAQCTTSSGQVIHPDGKQSLPYGQLVEAAAQLPLPRKFQLKQPADFKIVGTGLGHWDAPQIVTGRAIYGLDVRIPGQLFATLARCPVFSGKLDTFDDSAAKAVPGVKQVLALGDSVAVVATNSWAAIQGRSALKVTWNEGVNSKQDSDVYRDEAIKRLTKNSKPKAGVLEAVYNTPYEAHATMEPMNCLAYYHDGTCEVWAPTQNPQSVRQGVASATSLHADEISVHVPLIGGGFGRRLQIDYAVEAARLSKAIAAPVQVVWTRDDDLQHDFYEAMSVQYFKYPLDKSYVPGPSTAGGVYVPTGAWRSVENFTQAYGVQCFIDELALALKRDPMDLRLELHYYKQAQAVIKRAAEKSGWGTPMPAGEGRGMAYHATFNVTHVCQVAEVAVDPQTGSVHVKRVVCAVDCGRVVNPDNVAAQMESGIVFGLTAALKAQASLKKGRIQQSNFHDYPLLRMDEMPVIEVYINNSDNPPTGIGEMGVPPIAPAVANAVFAATGKRIRHIPILAQDLKA